MIILSDKKAFAKGGKRACYRHPEQLGSCLKVFLRGRTPLDQKQADPWWKQLRPTSVYDENIRDAHNLSQIYEKIGNEAEHHFPKSEGLVDTDLGTALSLQLIRDHDGNISASAKEYIIINGITPQLEAAIKALGAFLLKHLILFRDPFPHNIAIRTNANQSLEAVIIDGLGDSSVLPFHFIVPGLTQKKIRKKHARLLKGIVKTNSVDGHTNRGMRV
jgi:hypothetical protein